MGPSENLPGGAGEGWGQRPGPQHLPLSQKSSRGLCGVDSGARYVRRPEFWLWFCHWPVVWVQSRDLIPWVPGSICSKQGLHSLPTYLMGLWEPRTWWRLKLVSEQIHRCYLLDVDKLWRTTDPYYWWEPSRWWGRHWGGAALPVTLRWNEAKSPVLIPRDQQHVAQCYFLWGATPSSFLIWEGIKCGRGREMGGSSQDTRSSAPVQSGGGLTIFWQWQGIWGDGLHSALESQSFDTQAVLANAEWLSSLASFLDLGPYPLWAPLPQLLHNTYSTSFPPTNTTTIPRYRLIF